MASPLELEILDLEAIEDELARLDGWEFDGLAIRKTFVMGSFQQSIDWVNRVGEVAEREGHHPDIIINYKKVTLRCWTHKNNSVSKADIQLAEQIEKAMYEA
jgi:4a-hydroxytetrahydrobiopterin dehydratase